MSRYVILIALLAACSSSTQPAPGVAGTYQLTAVNGLSLPVAIPGGVGGTPATATGGSAVLTEDATVMAQLAMTMQIDGANVPAAPSLVGTYTIGHDTVYVRDAAQGFVIPAVFRDGVLTADIEGVSFRFVRK